MYMKDTTPGVDLSEAVHRILRDFTCHWPTLQDKLPMVPQPRLATNEE